LLRFTSVVKPIFAAGTLNAARILSRVISETSMNRRSLSGILMVLMSAPWVSTAHLCAPSKPLCAVSHWLLNDLSDSRLTSTPSGNTTRKSGRALFL